MKTTKPFESNLKGNFYKLWNRLSSGSYFPPAVKTVAIPKKSGGGRKLGIPTVSDRVAQMVVKFHFEPLVEPYFHTDSYGYRPNKSAHQALEVTRTRCWCYNGLHELDIKGATCKTIGAHGVSIDNKSHSHEYGVELLFCLPFCSAMPLILSFSQI